MRKSYFITEATLAAAFTIGCFNLLGQQSSPTQTTKNLGVVTFTNGIHGISASVTRRVARPQPSAFLKVLRLISK
jgi:hypothetical protein